MIIDWRPIQHRLGIVPDGLAGRFTFAALLAHVANRSLADRGLELGKGCADHFADYGITTKLRIAHWAAQACHESGNFRWMQEIWGPTAAQRKYEGRADLGNVCVGDGRRYAGRGIFQLTGRGGYREVGEALGLPLESNPELAADPGTSVLIACHYWKSRKLNFYADRDEVVAVSNGINRGNPKSKGLPNGLEDRILRLRRAKDVLCC